MIEDLRTIDRDIRAFGNALGNWATAYRAMHPDKYKKVAEKPPEVWKALRTPKTTGDRWEE